MPQPLKRSKFPLPIYLMEKEIRSSTLSGNVAWYLPVTLSISPDTVTCKTVPMFGTFVVYTIFQFNAWESRLALAGACEVQPLSYKFLFGSCDLAWWM